jgi:hypothetical protein
MQAEAEPAASSVRRVVLVLARTEADPAGFAHLAAHYPAVRIAWLTWDELAECPEHPHAEEFRRYLDWKAQHSA